MSHAARPLRSTRRLSNLTTAQMPKWYSFKNVASGPTQIAIFDEIGFYGCSAAGFLDELSGVPGDIELHLHSPGGDIYDGLAIYNGLLQARNRGTVQVIIDGLAASAASFIAMAASPGQLGISPHARMMIHDGFCMAIGNAADMRQLADQLDEESANIAGIYADRTGKPQAYWRGKMQAETWYGDSEAVAEGLADYIVGQGTPVDAWDMSVFAHGLLNAGGNGGWVRRDGKWVFDPDNDGDNDATPAGDTDHDYWDADGKQIKAIPPDPDGKQGKPLAPSQNCWFAYFAPLNADKYKQADRDRMAANGHAMPDGSYPIEDAEDLDNAIHAVGRGGADHDAIRKHIIKRAGALGLSSRIPDDWASDGSLKSSGSPDDLADPHLLAAIFSNALGGVSTR